MQPEHDEPRRQQVLAVRGRPLDEARPVLLAALADPSWRVRKEAVAAVAEREDGAALVPELIAALADAANAGLRNAALRCLEQIGLAAQEPLLAARATADDDQRKFVIELLGRLPTPAARQALREALHDRDLNVRVSAIEGLGAIGEPADGATLEPLLDQPLTALQGAVLEALARLGAPIPEQRLPALLAQPLLGPSLVAALASGDQAALEQRLIAIAGDLRFGLTARAGALGVLARHGGALPASAVEAARATVLELLHAQDEERRMYGIQLAATFHAPDLLARVLELADDPQYTFRAIEAINASGAGGVLQALQRWERLGEGLRELLIGAVGALQIREAQPRLLALLGVTDSSPRVIEAAVGALGAIGDAEVVEPLLAAATGDDELLAPQAINALRRVVERMGGTTPAAAQLRARLAALPPTPAIVSLLGQLATEAELPALAALSRHADPAIRRAVLSVLVPFAARLPESAILAALADEDAQVRAAAARLAGQLASAAMQRALLTAIDDPDQGVAATAIAGLGRHDQPEVLVALRARAMGAQPILALAALRALHTLNPPDLGEVLRAAALTGDPEVSKEVILLSDRLAGEHRRSLLVVLLEHEHWSVRSAAAQTLAAEGCTLDPATHERLLAREQDPLVRRFISELGGPAVVAH